MARGGINKVVVQQARQALIARGENPSIDAIRIELGNTGSKTTIHRYLKELNGQQPVASEGGIALSDVLSRMVGQLATQLQDEADLKIEQAESAFTRQREQLEAQLAIAQQALAAAHQQHQIDVAALAAESEKLLSTQSTLQAEQLRSASLNQSLGELQVRLADKEEQVKSLEDKHRHARDALEHYRNASREQREQEQRRHEAQLQQLQVEVRQLQQGMIVKQDELTRLHRDNERLLTEAAQLRREQERLDAELPALQARLTQAETAAQVLQVRLESAQQENQRLERARQEDAERLRQLQAELARRTEQSPDLYRALALRPDDCRPLLEAVLPLAGEAAQRLRVEFASDADRLRAEREVEKLLRDRLEALLPCQADGGQRSSWLVEGCVGAALHGGAFSIVLLRDGKPMLALVVAPAGREGQTDCIAWAAGLEGLLRNGSPLTPSLSRQRLEKGAQVLADRAEHHLRQWSAPAELALEPHPAYRLARVAAGDGVCALASQSVSQRSLRAALALLKAAGGVLLDARGQLIEPGRETLDGFWAGASNACQVLVERSRQVRLR